MERKRELTSVDCAALVRELGDYEGATVDKAYLYGDDLLRLRMRDVERGRLELFVEVGEFKRAHLADPANVPDAPDRPPEFAMTLRSRIAGGSFAGVEQHGFDRVLTFTFRRADGRTTRVVAELFGDGNVAVLDGNGEVLRSLETVRLSSRTVAPGAVYDYPDARVDPMATDYDAFAARMDDSDADVVRTLATQLNFGGAWGEELCTRAGVPYNQSIEETTEAEYRALYDAVDRLRQGLRSGAVDPRVYFATPGRGDRERYRVDVTPVPLAEREGQDCTTFDRFNDALDDYFSMFEPVENGDGAEPGTERPEFEAEIEKYERIIAQQEAAIEEFEEQTARERERAELLYAHYDTVDAVAEAVRSARAEGLSFDAIADRFEEGADRGIPAAEAVVDVDGSEGTITLDLDGRRVRIDPSEGVEHNADRLYQEAKRVAEKREGALEAIEDTREQLADVRERRDRWEADDGDPEADADADADTDTDAGDATGGDDDAGPSDEEWLSRSSIPVRYDEQWYEQFRWFHTGDGFLVIGGRNADQNEAIVEKYMERHDRFFHTRAHGGPATVLKATGPSEPLREVAFPDASLEEAAQFAVAYSSAWKSGRYADDAYAVAPDQVSKTPESGEYLSKGGFAIRGDRTYFRDVPARVAVGVAVEPESRVLGGPPSAIEPRTVTSVRLEPGRYAQNDAAKLVYRELRDRFADQSFLRKVASPDRIQEFLPPGGSDLIEE